MWKSTEKMAYAIMEGGIKVKYMPDGKALAECMELGKKVAKRLKEFYFAEK